MPSRSPAPRARRPLALAVALLLAAVLAAPVASAAAQDGDAVASVDRIGGADRVTTAVAVSVAGFDDTATAAVLARADAFPDALAAAPLAAALGAPLLLTPSDRLAAPVASELERLAVERVVLLGGPAALSDAIVRDLAALGVAVHRLGGDDRVATAGLVARAASALVAGGVPRDVLPDADGDGGLAAPDTPATPTVLLASAAAFPDALAAGPVAARLGGVVLLTAPDTLSAGARTALDDLAPDEVVVAGGPAAISPAVVDALDDGPGTVRRVAGDDRLATAAALLDLDEARTGRRPGLLAVSARTFPDALAAAPLAVAQGRGLLLLDERDGARSLVAARRDDRPLLLVGGPAAVSTRVQRELRLAALDRVHPAGGTRLFPDHLMVAFYGNARSAAMGVLGETTPEVAADRVRDAAAGFATPGRQLLPTFELIVSVAQRDPGRDGDYSAIGPLEDVQRYLDVARAEGVHLVLDIQPGRTDFLDQVRVFDAFLAQPDVHLALDPEWRMGPDERPGQVVGSVGAAEVQRVLDHVAALVRANDLPEKLVVLHQFRTSMVRDRDTLVVPDELALMVHVDGFGTRSQKLATYDALTGSDATDPFHHGFKLFYDEDRGLMPPADVLTLRPVVDLVSYQ